MEEQRYGHFRPGAELDLGLLIAVWGSEGAFLVPGLIREHRGGGAHTQ